MLPHDGIQIISYDPITNLTELDEPLGLLDNLNVSINLSRNGSDVYDGSEVDDRVFWALLLLPLPLLAVVGNILVILSVYRERNLQTVTNYFIVSLAVADLLVGAVVMPFAVYVLVSGEWLLSNTLCDFYIAVDVTCSTASIFNLVAISVDRFIAVTQPIKYSKHKNSTRVCLTIAVAWLVSAAIGSPIVLGLNTSPERIPELCVFYNSDFIIYSSLSSFYIPCIAMVFLYYRIFKAIHERAKKSRQRAANTESGLGRSTGSTSVNTGTPPPHQTNSTSGRSLTVVVECDGATNTASDDDTIGECDPPPLKGASATLLGSFLTETIRIEIPVNGNTDSGYGTSHVELSQFSDFEIPQTSKGKKARFNLGGRHKSSRKKREKVSAKKERKATKTLAIVLGVFLFCWVPFFTCNILDAICIKLNTDAYRPGMTLFLLTTWLGYINSCVNPVIYTIFNMEFRKAFKKLLLDPCNC